MSDKYIKQFYNEINEVLEGKYKIILEPGRELNDEWIEYDKVKWEIEEQMKKLLKDLKNNNTLSFEEKILEIYKYICLNYIYDDNVLFFFKNENGYTAVDWYGRIVEKEWIENRKKHNRRICYEFARVYAKAINELIENNEELEACMIGDIENLHYVVGLTRKEYSIILDLDDFNSIKDLTRLKLGLTIKGIRILRDESGKFKNAVEKFNEDRPEELLEIEKAKKELRNKDIIQYFKKVAEILKNHKIDSQGFCEYMKAILGNEEIDTDKIWKEVKEEGYEKRYSRCLIFNLNEKTYLVDTVDKILKEVKKENLNKEYILKPEENRYLYFGG